MDGNYNHSVIDKIFRRGQLRPAAAPILSAPRNSVSVDIPKPVKRPNAFFRFIFSISGKPFWEKNLTTLFYGPRSQGKSLHQAKTVKAIFEYLDGMYNIHPDLPQAVVVSNQKFNKTLEAKYLGKRLFYWESIQQLRYCMREKCWKDEYEYTVINQKWVNAFKGTKRPEGVPIVHAKKKQHRLHDCYLVIDDAATIIPADGWQDLPRWFRKMFAQAGHNGLHCVANIQDPLSCDINFRRYVDLCFKFTKVMGNRRPEAGKPPIRWIWGIYTSREVPAEELWMHGDKSEAEIQQEKIDRKEMENAAKAAGKKIASVPIRVWRRRFHWISRSATDIYDTLQNVPEYMPNTFEHYEITCQDPECKHVSVRHRVI